jgi:hypothetical protein
VKKQREKGKERRRDKEMHRERLSFPSWSGPTKVTEPGVTAEREGSEGRRDGWAYMNGRREGWEKEAGLEGEGGWDGVGLCACCLLFSLLES